MQNFPCHEPDASERNLSEVDSRSRAARSPPIASSVHDRPRVCRCRELQRELGRAELSGKISEFEALSVQALLAMAEGSEFATDYLEMADAVASSPHELAVAEQTRATYELLRDHLPGPGARTECLWSNLLFALRRIGKLDVLDAIDAMRIAS